MRKQIYIVRIPPDLFCRICEVKKTLISLMLKRLESETELVDGERN